MTQKSQQKRSRLRPPRSKNVRSSAKLSELEADLLGQLLQTADNFTLISLDFSALRSRPRQTALMKIFYLKKPKLEIIPIGKNVYLQSNEDRRKVEITDSQNRIIEINTEINSMS